MAKEKFLIVAVPMPDDCFSRFSESANRDAISAGTADPDDAYSWIEKSFEIQLIRHREGTHICSLTPSARYVWLENQFVGIPNAAWIEDGDPDGLERENGGEFGGYGTYRDDYDPRFVCETFTVDTVKDMDGLRKPGGRSMGSDAHAAYADKVWEYAEEAAQSLMANGAGGQAPILDAIEFRKWERACVEKVRQDALDKSKRFAVLGLVAL